MPKVFLVKNRAATPFAKDGFSSTENDPVEIVGKIVKNCSFKEYLENYYMGNKINFFLPDKRKNNGIRKNWINSFLSRIIIAFLISKTFLIF